MITLMLTQEFIPFPYERELLGFIRANYLALFPKLIDQSQFNHSTRALRLPVKQPRRYWVVQKGRHLQARCLLYTKSVSVTTELLRHLLRIDSKINAQT